MKYRSCTTAITLSIIMMCCVFNKGSVGIVHADQTPDYIIQVGEISEEFFQYYALSDAEKVKKLEEHEMLTASRRNITSGVLRDYTSFRFSPLAAIPDNLIADWLLEQKFICHAVTPLESNISKWQFPHIYQKGNAFIHIFKASARQVSTDRYGKDRKKLSGGLPFRVILIQYDNVTQPLYPCLGDDNAPNIPSIYGPWGK